jgi:arylsulfatase
MPLKKTSFLKSPFATGLKTACSVLTLTACLAIGSAQAADQGARHHARGQYDTVTATYGVVDGDELIVIGERFQVPVDTLKEQNQRAR